MRVDGVDGQRDALHRAAVRRRCELDDRVQWNLSVWEIFYAEREANATDLDMSLVDTHRRPCRKSSRECSARPLGGR